MSHNGGCAALKVGKVRLAVNKPDHPERVFAQRNVVTMGVQKCFAEQHRRIFGNDTDVEDATYDTDDRGVAYRHRISAGRGCSEKGYPLSGPEVARLRHGLVDDHLVSGLGASESATDHQWSIDPSEDVGVKADEGASVDKRDQRSRRNSHV